MAQVQRDALDVEDDRGHPLAEQRLLPVFVDEFFDLGGCDPFPVLDQALDGAELLDQLDRRFLADASDPRNIVRDIADQALEIDGLDRLKAVALAHPLRRVENRLGDAPFARQHINVVVDELQRIEVARDDGAVQAELARLARQSADDVVRLDPLHLVDRDAKGAHDVPREWKLWREFRRGGPARRLVLREFLVSKGPAAEVKRGQHVVRMLLQGQQQHRREPVGGVHNASLPVGQRGQREEGPVDERVAIDENEALLL